MNILRSNRPKCGSGRRLVEGVDMRKSQKSPSSEPRPTRHPPLCFFKKSLRCRQNVHFFPKGPLRGTKSSVITSRASGLSVVRRKIGFEPRFGAFLANSILGRLVAPQCESHSPHDAASRYNWSKFRTRGRKHTQDTAQMKAGMQKSRKLPDFVVRPAEAHASIFSRKLLLAPSNAQNFLDARPPLGARGPTAQIWDPLSERTPPVGLDGPWPTRERWSTGYMQGRAGG